MLKISTGFLSVSMAGGFTLNANTNQFEKDIISAADRDLEITFIGHASLMFRYDGKIIHIDPYSRLADYSRLPDADYVLLTHHHSDHLDSNALKNILKPGTQIILTEICAETLRNGKIMKNGDSLLIDNIGITAVPAYNIVHRRDNGEPFHVKGEGNGYVLTFGSTKIYIAGDTENIPEMKQLKQIHAAFIPVNLPYTMSLEMAADAIRSIKPEIVYPCHYGETEISLLAEMLKDFPESEIRIRKMK